MADENERFAPLDRLRSLFAPLASFDPNQGAQGDLLHQMMIGAPGALRDLAKSNIEASEAMRGGYGYDPKPAFETGLATMGAGTMFGPLKAAGETALGAAPVRVWHASPHEFTKFDISKVGSGQGSQAFGHGIYSAEARPVAESYLPEFARKAPWKYQGEAVTADSPPKLLNALDWIKHKRPRENESIGQFLEREANELAEHAEFARKLYGDDTAFMYERGADLIRKLNPNAIQPPKPSLYEVAMHADPERMLHWDYPLSQQHPEVRDAVARVMKERGVPASDIERIMPQAGSEAYETLSRYQPNIVARYSDPLAPLHQISPAGASRDLLREGVPGVAYRDQFSRSVADPAFVEQEIRRLKHQLLERQASTSASRHGDIARIQNDIAGYERQLLDLAANPPTHNFVNYHAGDLEILRKVLGVAAVPAAGLLMGDQAPQ